MKKSIYLLILLVGTVYVTYSQQVSDSSAVDRKFALNVYLDCQGCDDDHIKNNFKIVNYVNTYQSADVYILVTSIGTGDGGTEYKVSFIGQNRFSTMIYSPIFTLPPNVSTDTERETLLRTIRVGLGPFLLDTPYKGITDLTVDAFQYDQIKVEEGKADKFNNWKFEIGGAGSFDSPKYSKNYAINGNLGITKLTDKIKFINYNEVSVLESWDSIPGDTAGIYYMSNRAISSDNLFVKSLGKKNNFGIGGTAGFLINDKSNLALKLYVGPAIEFNFFNYDIASNKYFILRYGIDYEINKYKDTTLYGMLEENLFSHYALMHYYYIYKAIKIDATISASNYLKDISLYSVGAGLSFSLNCEKPEGLVISLDFGVSYSQDQISIVKIPEDKTGYYYGQYELETGLSYNSMISFSYRFGSKNDNYVNPRFEF
jgi:hypothetical protein